MKNIWRKMRDCWLDFWEDDELDMDKKHLSQHDKRSLLYGGFMIGVATFGLFSIGIIAGNIWTNHQNQKDMEEFLGTVVTYMATATDDEYEEPSGTIWCTASMDRMLKTLSDISRIRLTAAVWNGSCRSVSIWFS